LGCRLSRDVLLALFSLLVLIRSLSLALVLVVLLLLLLRTKQLFLLYELGRPLLQLRFGLVVLWRPLWLSLVNLPEVDEDDTVFLLLIFGEASELEDVIGLEQLGLLLLLLRWRALGPLGLGIAHGPGGCGD
jgi:hypothetical protein